MTRLERLFDLLHSGSSQAVKELAAKQIGEIVKNRPSDICNILERLYPYLLNKSWNTRLAAALAIEEIGKNMIPWDPLLDALVMEASDDNDISAVEQHKLSFETIDLQRAVDKGAVLLASSSDKIDEGMGYMNDLEPKDRLLLQQKLIKERMGLDFVEGGSSWIDEHDIALVVNLPIPSKSMRNDAIDFNGIFSKTILSENMIPAADISSGHVALRLLDTKSRLIDSLERDSIKYIQDHQDKRDVYDLAENPFEPICERLCVDLFDPTWEVRHGAAIGLREVINICGGYGGCRSGIHSQQISLLSSAKDFVSIQNTCDNIQWLEDVSVRLVCVLLLDEFRDFVGDEVVAPVREACAQALANVTKHFRVTASLVEFLKKCILIIAKTSRQSSELSVMLCLKYIFTARSDQISLVLNEIPELFGIIFRGLESSDEDTRSTTASALIPIAEIFLSKLDSSSETRLLSVLWNSLIDSDDLSSSLAPVMEMLVKVLHPRNNQSVSKENILKIIQFARHNVLSVRISTVKLLHGISNVESNVELLCEIFDCLVQNLFLESNKDLLKKTSLVLIERLAVVRSSESSFLAALMKTDFFGRWLGLVSRPLGEPIPQTAMPGVYRYSQSLCAHDIALLRQDLDVYSENDIIYNRIHATSCIAAIFAYLCVKPSLECKNLLVLIFETLKPLFPSNSKQRYSAFQGCIVGEFLLSWCETISHIFCKESPHLTHYFFRDDIKNLDSNVMIREFIRIYNAEVLSCLHGNLTVPLVELSSEFELISRDFYEFCDQLLSSGLKAEPVLVQDECDLFTVNFEGIVKDPHDDIKKRCMHFRRAVISMKMKHEKLTNRFASYLACVVCKFGLFYQQTNLKMTPIIRSFIGPIKTEDNDWFVKRFSLQIAKFVGVLIEHESVRFQDVGKKLSKNICAISCAKLVPEFARAPWNDKDEDLAVSFSPKLELQQNEHQNIDHIFASICDTFGTCLFSDTLPFLNIIMSGLSNDAKESNLSDAEGQNILNALGILGLITKHMAPDCLIRILENEVIIGGLLHFLRFPWPIFRYFTANTIVNICRASFSLKIKHSSPMELLITRILPLLNDSTSVAGRLGCAELLWILLENMNVLLVPYLVFFLVPTMSGMTDQNPRVREAVTLSFASVVKLMPLEESSTDPIDMPPTLMETRKTKRKFIRQLLDPQQLDDFDIPVKMNVDLRQYQKQGVNWLAFLNKYGLHGILCDDMGLGKTLQTICMLSSDHHLNDQISKETNEPMISLIVCPTSLVGHWNHEIQTFATNLKPLVMAGNSQIRKQLHAEFSSQHNVIITSYDILRNDLDFFKQRQYNYCVLDEGHIIKNPKTQLSMAVKSINAVHRLILTGTPIQNNVVELWSLFDFIMPGFLGSEKIFTERFAKPIIAMKSLVSGKSKPKPELQKKIQEKGILALEALHRQVLPFLMRRVKDDVLKDLPPKIIQDYYCEMSDLQRLLYDDFVKEQAIRIATDLSDSHLRNKEAGSHIFKALQYMRKLSNDPFMVLSGEHPKYKEAMELIVKSGSKPNDLKHCPKLMALKELLSGLGLGDNERDSSGENVAAVTNHRVLIFCQLKAMLNRVAAMLDNFMPSISYVRMEGSTEHSKRHDLVLKFNSDPSIDMMLLTTNVGGLGLNLTGADTVIFVEHDWNPMKDLQAMDRAHRLGQKRTVNVFRLITKNSLEEQIMSLQRFKLNVANTVVNEENTGVGLKQMAGEDVLDLFHIEVDETRSNKRARRDEVDGKHTKGMYLPKEIIDELDTLSVKYDDEEF